MGLRALAIGIVASAALLAACTQRSGEGSTAGSDGAGEWQQPRTEWGDPDLRGKWPISHLIGTPFLRPTKYGDRRVMTDEEFDQTEKGLEGRNKTDDEVKDNKLGAGHWAEAAVAQRLTSLLVDPPNGQFPELTEAAKAKAALMGSSWSREVFDKPTDFDSWDRCITRGLPPSMFPFNYNNGIEIHQAPGYVVIRLEMIHETRIVPVDGRPPLDPAIKQWMGESRGHWDGNTLVVETTNFNGQTGMTNVGIPGSPRGNTPTSEKMKITERFTRTADDTIEYSMIVEDPEMLTRPWAAAYPMKLDPEYQFFEYACNEDNSAVRNFIVTSRYERAHAGKKEAKP
ncbi:MAG TPA: hypothetical protein VFX89_15570 [Gammaproteobacteria bacterium]|nr:hypothetical protein [Gammaproteobacteria bacterium]